MTLAPEVDPRTDASRTDEVRTDDPDRLIDGRRPGYCLDAPFYISEEFYRRDIDAVFAATWIFAAAAAEVPEPGDFVTLDIGDYSVIIIRDDDEEIRAHHNVCRHRGARLLSETNGSVGNIVCSYHQWTYSPEGDLMSAGVQAPGFDRTCFSLRSVNVRVVSGLVFICLAQNPPEDFAEVADRIAPYIEPHALGKTKVAAQVDLIEHANWKLVMENNRECYHCEAGHPELTCTFFPTYGYAPEAVPKRLKPAYQRYLDAEERLRANSERNNLPTQLIEELSGRPTGFRIERAALDGKGESYTMDGAAASAKLLSELDTPELGRLSMHTQPNAWFHFMGDHAVTFSVIPLGPDTTRVRSTWLVHEDAVEGVDYDVENLTTVWVKTNEQDAALCAKAHRGISSPAYVPGPYAPTESDLEEFCTWYIERLQAHRAHNSSQSTGTGGQG
ncbi:aromatic ring-hydroxylating oxygenase subunit alpha [Brevibacterium aurantiacum]|uniref:aromatic ring-hydroxylating oxygenase subunit alpha n=1 Tax=Brevibacterium aurantiacum TaxID=273384 RepID=UPI0019D01316|nr:aromatic ring-hydroxylating dioxygenase subunit alpha [Brevibacterium aurantiacum]